MNKIFSILLSLFINIWLFLIIFFPLYKKFAFVDKGEVKKLYFHVVKLNNKSKKKILPKKLKIKRKNYKIIKTKKDKEKSNIKDNFVKNSNRKLTLNKNLKINKSFSYKSSEIDTIEVSYNNLKSMIIKKVNPSYPPKARLLEIEKDINVKVVIDTNGYVVKANMKEDNWGFSQEIKKVIFKWRFRPYIENRKKYIIISNLIFKFRLE